MTPLVVDAGALIAAQNAQDPDHGAVSRLLASIDAPLVTTQLVLAEVDYMVLTRGGPDAEMALLNDVVEGNLATECLNDTEMARAVDVVARYRDLRVGLADASLVVLCARYRTRTILTLDERCFRAMTPLNGGHFRLLPADG